MSVKNVSILSGGAYEIKVKLLDDDNSPYDPTGLDIFYAIQINNRYGPLVTLDTQVITVSQEGSDFFVSIPLTHETTKDLPLGNLYHELYIIENQEPSIFMTGNINVVAAAARHYVP